MTSPSDGTDAAADAPKDGHGRRRRGEELREEIESHVSHAREHFDELKGEFESHVSHAREQFEETNERIKERTGRDLIVAIGIGIVLGGVFLASLIFVKWLFVPIVLGCSLLGIQELTRALRAGGRRVDIIPQMIGATLLVVTAYFAELWLFWVTLSAVVALVVVWRVLAQMAAADGRTYGDVLGDVLAAGLLQVYVPFFASLALLLLRQDGGQWWVLAFVAVVITADTGAYASGLMFGKHPMAPRISPKKTWEGFAGAFLASGITATLLAIFLLDLEWWMGPIMGVVLLLTATIGDLAESMIKRDLGIKDMSSWVPGHGGVLDRLDSILPSAAAALALYFFLQPAAVVL